MKAHVHRQVKQQELPDGSLKSICSCGAVKLYTRSPKGFRYRYQGHNKNVKWETQK